MNSKLSLVVIGFVIAGVVLCIETDDEQRCTDQKDPKFKLRVGEQGPGPLGQCIYVKCERIVNNKPVVTAIGCGVFVPSPGCNVTDYDRTKLYPDCCPNEVC